MTWPEYGKVLRRYSGTGTIGLGDLEAPCSFECAQLAGGTILLKCDCDRVSINLWRGLVSRFAELPLTLHGKTDATGQSLRVTKGTVTRLSFSFPTTGATVEAVVPHVEIGNLPTEQRVGLVFGLTNFEFIGNEITEKGRHILGFNLEGKRMVIERISEYKVVIEQVRAERGIDVTAELRIDCDAGSTDEITFGLAERLCSLLSLARGVIISWLCRDAYLEGEVVHTTLRHSVVSRGLGMAIISRQDSTSTAAFIEGTHGRFSELEERYSLKKTIHEYCSAREGTFLELRGLQAATLLDFLCGRYGKMAALKRRSFRRRLSELAREYRVPMGDEIGQIVKARNSLVHEAAFSSDDHWREYLLLLNALDKILLRMLGYEGPYRDVLNGFKVVPLKAA